MMMTMCLYISADERLRHFSIIVGPNNGTYKKCGSSTNDMSIGDTTAFFCEAHARGTSLKIKLVERKEILTLCEVFILGTGMIVENSCIAMNKTYYIIHFYIIQWQVYVHAIWVSFMIVIFVFSQISGGKCLCPPI